MRLRWQERWQERRPREDWPGRQRGYTLVEAIVSLIVLAIVGALVGMFIRFPIESYFDTERRARLTDSADGAVRRMARDLRLALPNSLRVMSVDTGVPGRPAHYLEFMQTRAGGRYRAEPASSGSGAVQNALDFTINDKSFQVIGDVPVHVAGNYLVVANLGEGSGSDAYRGENISPISAISAAAAGGEITFGGAGGFRFPVPSPGNRFFIVDSRVTYGCDPASGELRRYSGYGLPPTGSGTQAVPPVGAASALLAEGVTACTVTYDSNVANTRSGVVSISLTLADPDAPDESVTLFHQVHVSNVP
jgi:MSHA biogenesis protein MshO